MMQNCYSTNCVSYHAKASYEERQKHLQEYDVPSLATRWTPCSTGIIGSIISSIIRFKIIGIGPTACAHVHVHVQA